MPVGSGQDWENFLDWLKTMDLLGERYPAPAEPAFPAYQGLRPEEEKTILDAMQRRIRAQTNEHLRSTRIGAASRGFYRSGQLPALEAKTRRAGSEAYASGLANYYTGKAGRMQSWNQLGANFNLNKWQTLYDAYQKQMGGVGSAFGKFYRPG